MRAPAKTVARARRLRRKLTLPEARLWRCLKARAPERPVFRRQHPIGPYVIDLYCAKARLAIEIDGMSHDMSDRPHRDARRDAWLKERGVTVMRVAATDLMQRFEETADAIMRMAAELSAQ
jgi:very-short-patch-repair endonuclease